MKTDKKQGMAILQMEEDQVYSESSPLSIWLFEAIQLNQLNEISYSLVNLGFGPFGNLHFKIAKYHAANCIIAGQTHS